MFLLMLLSHSIVYFLAYFVERNFNSRRNLDKEGKFLVDQFCYIYFQSFSTALSPFLLVSLSCSVCVLLQGKRSSASPVSVKFVMVKVIHFQDLGCFFAIFIVFSIFNFRFLASSGRNDSHFTSGAKLCFAFVYNF